jgi:hypothetical protein
MIFPPESIFELRRELVTKLEAGEITDAEMFRQALAVDPSDPAALRFHAFTAEENGDLAAAEAFGRRFILADPTSHEGYLLLGRVLSDARLAAAYRALGEDKLHFDPEALDEYSIPGEPFPAPDATPVGEPEAVAHELEPHRLIHQLFAAGLDAIPRSLVDRIVACGADCAPLLLGILNAYGEDVLHETDDALVARALALLGEIGDPAALPALAKFLSLEDDTVGGAARWAFLRIARSRPAETLELIRTLSVGAEALDLATLAQQLCLMPDVPGRAETLLGLAVNIPELDGDERALVVLSMLTSAHIMEHGKGNLAASIEAHFGNELNGAARKEIKAIREELDTERETWHEDEPSIYEVACEPFEAEDEEQQTVVRDAPKIGRNEPCWCGSGKKYKKCHLESDAGH